MIMRRSLWLVLPLMLSACSGTATITPDDDLTWGKLAVKYANTKAEVVRHIDWIRGACAKNKLDKSRCSDFERQVVQLAADDRDFQSMLVKKIDTPGTSGSVVDGTTLNRFFDLVVTAGKIAAMAGLVL